ncbi:tRNA (5-methylaminomethyl-2-thiouridine)(34)-methyltransferase MnmD [Roseobacter sp. N2S]|uniref:tRNA (5-methylaminomethyl-2-thiouridine)(34)-methyltransferase MnmD n=1 Tax=Roseobacter sp. N2S TaxID=2663844 RepID=UPI00285423E3|nr:tRNA (5-methylaminomethyl-2-thiouridine)(34)-methyltransferase MnmD [Roseobacter sp. N2S]MDR6267408.1 tRNA U34 5-methylaminomethyl-2-thiouridine-forming methyltransferase MnmC [Roseobacter sp. N2S]
MSDQNEYAQLDWRDGKIPVARRFDDPYFSLDDGIAETGHVFLAGNDLPTRFAAGFRIAELGFGTGLNLLCAWKAWEEAGQTTPLQFTSFEAFPMAPEDITKAQSAWPELQDYAARFAQLWHGAAGILDAPTLSVRVIYGDARQTLPNWAGQADAWFLDGFSPAKNPEMWGADLMAQVASHTANGGSFATYTAAGHVRRALASAGFQVTRGAGFGRKRHMSRGFLEIG